MKGVGEPCAGEPHARFDGRGLETEHYGVTAPAPDPTQLPMLFEAVIGCGSLDPCRLWLTTYWLAGPVTAAPAGSG